MVSKGDELPQKLTILKESEEDREAGIMGAGRREWDREPLQKSVNLLDEEDRMRIAHIVALRHVNIDIGAAVRSEKKHDPKGTEKELSKMNWSKAVAGHVKQYDVYPSIAQASAGLSIGK